MIKIPGKSSDYTRPRPKRFWAKTATSSAEDGFRVLLDGRPVKTPAGSSLVLPSLELARRIESEWSSVSEHLDYEALPLTRLAFAAIDIMPHGQSETIVEVLRYAETDLVSYPSTYPEALQAREDAVWLPLIAWTGLALDLHFEQNRSLVHRPQPAPTLEKLQALVTAMSPWQQAGLMSAIPLLGSVVLALALSRGQVSGEQALAASLIGEDFQADIWGRDAEAALRADSMKKHALSLEVWFDALRHTVPKA